MREATVTGRHAGLRELDRTVGAQLGVRTDLVQITGAVSLNFCTRYLGLVVSIDGARDGYPSIDELPGGGPPFHPLCSKGTTVYIEQLVSKGRQGMHTRALQEFRSAQRSGRLTENLTA